MVSYKVSISDEAKEALQEIYNWLKVNESTTTANKVRDAILDEIEVLVVDIVHSKQKPDRLQDKFGN